MTMIPSTNVFTRIAKICLVVVVALSTTASWLTLAQAEPRRPECIVPGAPGGGFDLTCRLAQSALQASHALKAPMRIVYMPGGIGAVAYNNIVTQRPSESGTIIAFSSGSLLNLAQGKFGRYTVDDVRWLVGIGADYGMALVREESPFTSLGQLMQEIKTDPGKIVFGASGTVGSQDWMKAALTARQAGVDYKRMRFVAFEGGGEGVTALRGGHIDVFMGDASEAISMLEGGVPLRVLAIYSEARLPGTLENVPTAREQGYDIVWPVIRGFYVGPKVSDEDYLWWTQAFQQAMAQDGFAQLQTQQGLFPFSMTGEALDAYVKDSVRRYAGVAADFGLLKQ